MSGEFFIDRAGQRHLVATLRKVPSIVEDLAVTETRQAVIRKAGMGFQARSKPGSRVPYHGGAFEAREALHAELVGWVRLTAEPRPELDWPTNDLLGMARWLDRHVIQLAMTEGAETAPAQIAECVLQCERMVDLPPEDDIVIDERRLAAANGKIVTAYQVERIAQRLGDAAKGLTRDRVRTLVRAGQLTECDNDNGTAFYRLGDVLAAHLRHARRQRA